MQSRNRESGSGARLRAKLRAGAGGILHLHGRPGDVGNLRSAKDQHQEERQAERDLQHTLAAIAAHYGKSMGKCHGFIPQDSREWRGDGGGIDALAGGR